MSPQAIYTKTEAGRNEIKTRANKLSGGLRSLLLVVDGQRTRQQLETVVAALRAPPDALQQLVALGLIVQEGAADSPDLAPTAAPLSESANRYSILHTLMSDAVREHLGLRGYFFQLKIERAADAAELADLLPELRASLVKAKNEEFAEQWSQRMRVLANI